MPRFTSSPINRSDPGINFEPRYNTPSMSIRYPCFIFSSRFVFPNKSAVQITPEPAEQYRRRSSLAKSNPSWLTIFSPPIHRFDNKPIEFVNQSSKRTTGSKAIASNRNCRAKLRTKTRSDFESTKTEIDDRSSKRNLLFPKPDRAQADRNADQLLDGRRNP